MGTMAKANASIGGTADKGSEKRIVQRLTKPAGAQPKGGNDWDIQQTSYPTRTPYRPRSRVSQVLLEGVASSGTLDGEGEAGLIE